MRIQRMSLPGCRSLVALVAICLTIGGCSTPVPTTEGGKEIAVSFLNSLREDRMDDAWAGTTAEFRSMLGQEGLKAYLKAHPALKSPASFERMEATERNGLKFAECLFVTADKKAKIKVLLGREGSDWKVERLDVEPH